MTRKKSRRRPINSHVKNPRVKTRREALLQKELDRKCRLNTREGLIEAGILKPGQS